MIFIFTSYISLIVKAIIEQNHSVVKQFQRLLLSNRHKGRCGCTGPRRVWGGNPNKYLTGGQMSEKRNLVHWSILALHDCTLPLASVRHFFPVCINAFCKFSFAYYSSIGCRFWQATSFSVTNNLWNSFSARWSGKNFSLAYYRTWQRKNGWKVKRTIKNAATHFRSLLLYSGNLKF